MWFPFGKLEMFWRSNQSILKEISPEYSLEGLMLKLKLQYFGHLMRRVDSLEKTLKLAGDRIGYVCRSRMQWRYIGLLLHPDEKACLQFIADAEIYGLRWAESTKNNYPPDKMFPDLYP